MKSTRFVAAMILAAAGLAIAVAAPGPSSARAVEEIPAHRQAQIRSAVPEQARVAPKKPRTVLIFNTPDHLYPKDPHKGYCIPYGSFALQVLGEKTGAYRPVVSSDLSMFLPENIGQFDAVVLNNTSGPWITPTEDDAKRPEFRRYGADLPALEQILRKSLLDYVFNGGGLVGLHFAAGANPQWPEFHELLGGRFSGHPWKKWASRSANRNIRWWLLSMAKTSGWPTRSTSSAIPQTGAGHRT